MLTVSTQELEAAKMYGPEAGEVMRGDWQQIQRMTGIHP